MSGNHYKIIVGPTMFNGMRRIMQANYSFSPAIRRTAADDVLIVPANKSIDAYRENHHLH